MPEEKSEPDAGLVPASINESPAPDVLTREDLKLSRGLKTANVFSWTIWILAISALLFQAFSGLQPGGDVAFTTQVAQIIFWILITVCVITEVIWRTIYVRSPRQGVKKLQEWAQLELDYPLSTYQAYNLVRTLRNKVKDQQGNLIIASGTVKADPPVEFADIEEKILLRLISNDEDGVTLTFRPVSNKQAPWAPIPKLKLRELIHSHTTFVSALHENDNRVLVPFNKSIPPEPVLAIGEDNVTYTFVFSSEKEAEIWAFQERQQVTPESITLARLTLEEFLGDFSAEVSQANRNWGVILNSGSDTSVTIQEALIPLFFQEKLPWLETTDDSSVEPENN